MPEPPDLIPAELAGLRLPPSAASTPPPLLPRRADTGSGTGTGPPASPPKNPTRRDFLLAGLVAIVLLGGLLLVTTRPWSRPEAAEPPASDSSCRSGVVQAVLTPSSTVEGNVHIRLSTRLTVPVTITELFLRSPSISGDYDGVVNPPAGTVISAGHPYDWDVFLQTPVTGTIIGIHKGPYGINAIHATWTAADGSFCDRVG
jgi:hypothetical protein